MSGRPIRILIVSEIPTPYRLPLYRRLAESRELELEIVFCSHGEPDRPWELEPALEGVPHRFMWGISPTASTRKGTFVYQINPGVLPLVARSKHDAIVVGGYSVFAEQIAIVAAQLRRVPYLLHSESTLSTHRPRLVRIAKEALVRPTVRAAAAGLAVGSEAAVYLEYYGLPRERIRIVPNTIDVAEYQRAATAVQGKAAEVRATRGLPERFVLYAGRLVEDKGVLDLLEAYRSLGPERLPLLVAGEGVLGDDVRSEPGVRYLGFVQPDDLLALFALADWVVVPSRHEPWGVVVNEALACGTPVIATDQVGAAVDLVEDGVNGRIVAARSPAALADALRGPRTPANPGSGRIASWTHEFAAEQFIEAVQLAVAAPRSDS